MPRTQGGNGNLWYSYTYGPAMWVAMSSEHDFSEGSPQWLFIQSQFAACNRSQYPWLFLTLHRPIYSVDADEVPSHVPGGSLSVALEPLMRQYGVDVVFQGHEHTSERTSAVYNGTTITSPDANGVYNSPGAPIYIVQGNSGADLDLNHCKCAFYLLLMCPYLSFFLMYLTTLPRAPLHYPFYNFQT